MLSKRTNAHELRWLSLIHNKCVFIIMTECEMNLAHQVPWLIIYSEMPSLCACTAQKIVIYHTSGRGFNYKFTQFSYCNRSFIGTIVIYLIRSQVPIDQTIIFLNSNSRFSSSSFSIRTMNIGQRWRTNFQR